MNLNTNVINDWDKWKKTLSAAIYMGETVGLSQNTITEVGSKVGGFLSSNVDPENREQRLLKELFDSSTKEEQKILTKVIIKMVENDN